MATLLELHEMISAPETANFRNKVRIAIAMKALSIALSSTPTENEISWAKNALRSPGQMLDQVLHFVIANNAQFTVEQIQNAIDEQIQTSVDSAVDTLLSQ